MEVLTLQLGHFSNHIGAHFWNIQDEVAGVEDRQQNDDEDHQQLDHDRLMARIEPRRGEVSWRPRLVLVDKKGAFSVAGAADWWATDEGSSRHSAEAAGLWDFAAESHGADVVFVHPFQRDLEEEERVAAAAWAEAGTGNGWNASSADGWSSDWPGMDVDAHEDGCDRWGENAGAGSHREGSAQSSTAAVFQNPIIKTSQEYDFRNTVRTWTDYLKIRVPTKCVHELQGCHHGVAPFATFFDGRELRGRDDEEELLDLTRRQAELCDQLDAVHFMVDMQDGFGGVGDLVLRWIHEEQPKCGKIVAAVQPELSQDMVDDTEERCGQAPASSAYTPHTAAQDVEACAWVSAAFSLAGILDTGVDTLVPIAVPLWSAGGPSWLPTLQRNSLYEVSAPIASAFDTATLPYRLRGGLRPSHFLAALAPSHRPVCGLLQSLPAYLPTVTGKPTPLEGLFDLSGIAVDPINPYTSLVLRGGNPRQLVDFASAFHPRALRFSFAHEAPLPIPLPFPQVFSPAVSRHGLVPAASEPGRTASDSSRERGVDVEECPVATQLHAAAQAASRPRALKRMTEMVKSNAQSSWGALVRSRYDVEVDEFREVLEVITEHLECGGQDSGSESGGGSGSDY